MSIYVRLPVTSLEVQSSPQEIPNDVTGSLNIGGFSSISMVSPCALRCPVPLAPVLEPVGHLGGGQAGALGQLPLLTGTRVRVVIVPLSQDLRKPGI
jgi:hypothetical protein